MPKLVTVTEAYMTNIFVYGVIVGALASGVVCYLVGWSRGFKEFRRRYGIHGAG